MQLNSFTDYGLRALILLATLPPGSLTSAREISEVFDLSQHHMMKIIRKLAQLGLIETIRGKKGGIRLKQASENINLGQVIRAIEPLQLIDCSEQACHITGACRLKAVLANAKNAFLDVLDDYSLADMVKGNPELKKILLKEVD